MIGLLIRAVQALGDEGQTEIACRIAASAWVALYDVRSEEAEKLSSALTRLNPKERNLRCRRNLTSASVKSSWLAALRSYE